MASLGTYLSFVRFSHSVFALPFALTGALLASRETPLDVAALAWILVAWWRRAAPPWASIAWSMRASTPAIRARRTARCRAAR